MLIGGRSNGEDSSEYEVACRFEIGRELAWFGGVGQEVQLCTLSAAFMSALLREWIEETSIIENQDYFYVEKVSTGSL